MDNDYDYKITALVRKTKIVKASCFKEAVKIADRDFGKGKWESVAFITPEYTMSCNIIKGCEIIQKGGKKHGNAMHLN